LINSLFGIFKFEMFPKTMSRSFTDLAYIFPKHFVYACLIFLNHIVRKYLYTTNKYGLVVFFFQAHRLSLSGHITQLKGIACGIYTTNIE